MSASVRRVPAPTYPTFAREEIKGRIDRICEALLSSGIELLLLTARENIVYFSGLSSSAWVQRGVTPAVLLIEAESGATTMALPDFWLGTAEKTTWWMISRCTQTAIPIPTTSRVLSSKRLWTATHESQPSATKPVRDVARDAAAPVRAGSVAALIRFVARWRPRDLGGADDQVAGRGRPIAPLGRGRRPRAGEGTGGSPSRSGRA